MLSRSEDEILFSGTRGPGKSVALMAWMVEPEYITNRRYRGLVIRKTFEDLKDFIDRAREFWSCLGVVVKGNPAEAHFPSGAIIRFGHMKDENAYEKYKGHEYQKIGIEELTLIPYLKNYLMLLGSNRSTIGVKAQCFCTTNPQGIGNDWVQERFIDFSEAGIPKQDETGRWRINISGKLSENPTLFNDRNYVAILESQPDHIKRAWLYGEWGVGDKQFFSGIWSKETHVIPTDLKLIKDARWLLRGLDWGYRDPFVCLWAAVMPPPRRRVIFYREFAACGLTEPEQAARVLAHSLGEKIQETIADPSVFNLANNDRLAGRSYADVWEENDLFAVRGMNRRIPGWARLREGFKNVDELDGKPVIQIMDCCKGLIRELPRLIWDDRDPEDVDDRPGNDHHSDTARYICASHYLGYLGKEKETVSPKYNTVEENMAEYIKKNTYHKEKAARGRRSPWTFGGRVG